MRIHIVMLLCMVALVSSCSEPADEPTAPQAAAPATVPLASAPAVESVSPPAPVPASDATTPAAATTEAQPAVELPEGFTSRFHVHPEMTLTGIEVVNADQAEYKVTGELRASSLQVLNYFVQYFQDNGWEEDMIMEQEGTTVVSFKKDGYLQYVDSHEGGIGAKITITTGKV